MQIARDLIEAIKDNRYPVGELLPPEVELCRIYKVSRFTVRSAIRQLQDLGLVSRRTRAGTRVETDQPSLTQPMSIAYMVQVQAEAIRIKETIGLVTVDKTIANRTGLPLGSRWLRVTCAKIMSESGPPICATDIYINQKYESIADKILDTNMLIYLLIERECGIRISEILQDIRVTELDAEPAGLLNVKAGSLGLEIIRRYIDDEGDIVELAINTHAAENFTYSTRLSRTELNALDLPVGDQAKLPSGLS